MPYPICACRQQINKQYYSKRPISFSSQVGAENYIMQAFVHMPRVTRFEFVMGLSRGCFSLLTHLHDI